MARLKYLSHVGTCAEFLHLQHSDWGSRNAESNFEIISLHNYNDFAGALYKQLKGHAVRIPPNFMAQIFSFWATYVTVYKGAWQ